MNPTLQTATVSPLRARASLRLIGLIALASIGLGIVMQSLIVAIRLTNGVDTGQAQLVVELANGVTWSFFVCSGIALATTISKARSALAGLVGLITGPVALAIAKSAQKVVAELMDVGTQPGLLSLTQLSIARAIEYGILGYLLARLARRDETSVWPYLGIGIAVGAICGGGITWISHQIAEAAQTIVPPVQSLTMTANEVLFPVGCALVIWIAQLASLSVRAVAAK